MGITDLFFGLRYWARASGRSGKSRRPVKAYFQERPEAGLIENMKVFESFLLRVKNGCCGRGMTIPQKIKARCHVIRY
jgi:hypothetical protein